MASVAWAADRSEVVMPATTKTCGFNHVATMTADLDRYLAFYKDIFRAEVEVAYHKT
jgi:predicted enzyme related to lactoylglutathione lyase